MKKIGFYFLMFFSLSLFPLFLGSCKKASSSHEHKKGEHHDEDKDHEEHHHHQGSGHMAHMKKVREALKKKLGKDYDKPVDISKADLANGKKIFLQTCATCHGTTGKGDGPAGKALNPKPADFTDPEHSRFYSDQGRLWIIRNGIPIPGTAMVGWEKSLGKKGTLDVFAYILTLRKKGESSEKDHDHEGKKIMMMITMINSSILDPFGLNKGALLFSYIGGSLM
ncbi:MAG: hypothetical protein D6785_02110 [Planctomycetota bacterium]|nr:MAG: hypothetical protein D6785_02110 [Planctomycetota bacterium]